MIRRIVGYESAPKFFDGIRLNANEGNLNQELGLYPLKRDSSSLGLFSKIYKTDPREILIDRGIDGVLEVCFQAVLAAGDLVLSHRPTYGMYEVLSRVNNAEYKEVLFEDLLEEVKKKKPKILIICRPNNPTGEVLDIQKVRDLKNILPTDSLMIIDEAYGEYLSDDESCIEMARTIENVLVCRTLSKAHSLASLRVGFGIGTCKLISSLIPFQAPYPIPGPVYSLLSKVITPHHIERVDKEIVRVKSWQDDLKEIYDKKILVGGNFIYIKNRLALDIFNKLKERGFLVRFFSSPKAIRITIGTDNEMVSIKNSLKDLL